MKKFILTLLIMAFGSSCYAANVDLVYPADFPTTIVVPAQDSVTVKLFFVDVVDSNLKFTIVHTSKESVTYDGSVHGADTNAPKNNGVITFGSSLKSVGH